MGWSFSGTVKESIVGSQADLFNFDAYARISSRIYSAAYLVIAILSETVEFTFAL